MTCWHSSVAKNPARNTRTVSLLLLVCTASQMQFHSASSSSFSMYILKPETVGVASGQYCLDMNQGRMIFKKRVPTL
ncbi:hypothetical protein COCSADRAFT_37087, partial [Bipolaris sorokiniana ND90Pr]